MSEITVEDLGRGGAVNADFTAKLQRKYKVIGAADEVTAKAAILSYVTTDPGLTIGSLVLDQITADEVILNVYEGTAIWSTFARRSPPSIGESQFNFELTTQPQRVYLPLGSITVYKEGSTPDITVQLIGDRRDGKDPEGCEIFEPTYGESVTLWLPAASVDGTFRETIKACVGRTNSGTFFGHAAGEVLLTGVSGAKRGAFDWEVTYRWAVRSNQSDMTIAGISGISKTGWQYLWPVYRTGGDTFGLAQTVTHICVATVFPSAAFSALGLPGS